MLSTILKKAQQFDFDETSLEKAKHARLHSTRWPNALDFSLNMNVERCIVNTVFSRIEAAASINIFVKKCCFNVRPASINGIFCNSPKLSNMLPSLWLIREMPLLGN